MAHGPELSLLVKATLLSHESTVVSAQQTLDPLKVYFEENNDEVEVEEEDDVPKRTTHGRKATAFVPKSKGKASAVAAQAVIQFGCGWLKG